MTTTYDPTDAVYRDEADLRVELARVHDVCHGCRRCIDLCPSFTTLFDLLDRQQHNGDGDGDGHEDGGVDASLLTPAQQDEIVDACFQCTACSSICPYTPDRHEQAVDIPRLMLRAKAVQYDNGLVGTRRRTSPRVMARLHTIGRLASRAPDAANWFVGGTAGSRRRRTTRRLTGLSATRRLPTWSGPRFSSWFAARPRVSMRRRSAEVSIVPTCIVEHQAPEIGRDLVKVYERNGIVCAQSDVRCCGATLLHAGDVDRFAASANANVTALAAEVRSGHDIVVAQPTCAHVIRTSYADAVDDEHRDDAELVARHTFDAADFLMRRHRSDDVVLDTDFVEPVPQTVAYHVSGHLRAVEDGVAGRDLLKLTGTRVRLVQRSTGTEGVWDLRGAHDDVAAVQGRRVADDIERADREVVAGDCHLSNLSIAEHTGREVLHPFRLLARAYGLADHP